MAEWTTAEQVAVRSMVGARRLLADAKRGDLVTRRCADGRVPFDAEGGRGSDRRRAGPGSPAVIRTTPEEYPR